MKIIYRGRQQGKTLELIKHSAETGAVIITTTYYKKERIEHLARSLGLSIPNPIVYKDLKLLPAHTHIIMDDADALLQLLFTQEIEAISMTNRDVESDPNDLFRKFETSLEEDISNYIPWTFLRKELLSTLRKGTKIMETILLYCQTQEEALHAVNDICMDIKALPEDSQHQLFMNRRIFGMYSIFPGTKLEDSAIGVEGKAEKVQPGDRELIFFPAEKEDAFEKLKAGKNLVMVKNCNYIIGEADSRKKRRANIIDWLLGKADILTNTVDVISKDGVVINSIEVGEKDTDSDS